MGILSVIAGLILLAIPGISLVTLVVLLSVWLIVFGGMEISLALRIRSGRHALGRPPEQSSPLAGHSERMS